MDIDLMHSDTSTSSSKLASNSSGAASMAVDHLPVSHVQAISSKIVNMDGSEEIIDKFQC
jgi:hypothetical protein